MEAPHFMMKPAEIELLRLYRGLSPAGQNILMGQAKAIATVRRRWPQRSADVLVFRRQMRPQDRAGSHDGAPKV